MNETYLETFTNNFGERWWFDYNNENDIGVLWGDDVSNEKFYVFEGICPPLILNQQETNWLNNAYNKHAKPKNTYLNLNIKIKTNKYATYLENNYCPICLNQKNTNEFEDHHCIPASEGGSDDVVNILNICNSCHSLITRGCYEDMYPRYYTAIYHQMYLFGIDFYKMNPFNNKRFKHEDKGLYENRPYIKEAVDRYENLSNKDQLEFNKRFKKQSLYFYKYYRSMVRNIIPNDELIATQE